MHEILRRPPSENGIPFVGGRAEGIGALSESYGSTYSRYTGGVSEKNFCIDTLYYKLVCRLSFAAEKENRMKVITVLEPNAARPAVAQAPQLHVAIISDGNGRWATARGLPRSAGHRAGAETARRIIEAAPRLGIHTLTLFALSSANWKRPDAEVQAILRLLHEYLLTETTHCIEEGVRLSIIGRRDRLPATLRQAISDSEAATAKGTRLHLRLAGDYSAREAIYHAACRFYQATALSPESFRNVTAEVPPGGATAG